MTPTVVLREHPGADARGRFGDTASDTEQRRADSGGHGRTHCSLLQRGHEKNLHKQQSAINKQELTITTPYFSILFLPTSSNLGVLQYVC
jgi:hypothetical protein